MEMHAQLRVCSAPTVHEPGPFQPQSAAELPPLASQATFKMNLKTQQKSDTTIDLVWSLTILDASAFGLNLDIGGVQLDINVFKTALGVLFGPAGFLMGWAADALLEHLIVKVLNMIESVAPVLIDREMKKYLGQQIAAGQTEQDVGHVAVVQALESGMLNDVLLGRPSAGLSSGQSPTRVNVDLSRVLRPGFMGGQRRQLATEARSSIDSDLGIPCYGTGLYHKIPKGCLSSDAKGDLELYCVKQQTRFCFKGELCPWRDRTEKCMRFHDLATCSIAGGVDGGEGSMVKKVTGIVQKSKETCIRYYASWWHWWKTKTCKTRRWCEWTNDKKIPRFKKVGCDAGSVVITP